MAVMGNLDLFIRDSNTVVRRVIKIIGHRRYDPDTFVNDIALLKLNAPVQKDHPTAQPIRLSKTEAKAGVQCQSSGWGSIQYEENARAVRHLMAVNISINSRYECNRRDSHAGSVIRGQFCAGPFIGGKDTCQGDSGGLWSILLKLIIGNMLLCNFRTIYVQWSSSWNHISWIRMWTTKLSRNIYGCWLL